MEKSLQSNKMNCKKEPFEQQLFLNDMLTEAGNLVKEDPESLEKHAKEHCEKGSSKTISRNLSKLFSTIKSPSVVLVDPPKKDKSSEPVREPQKLDGLEFSSLLDGLGRCQNLLKIVEDSIEVFRPHPQLRRSKHVFFHTEKESNTDRLIISSQHTASPSA
ncbi:hypothetical protein [Legionella tunisiensis]|uniref:hypothetical protein n=1 Tax=Legionella tunisiensis TaxID=1034944 RepID=UPI0012E99A0F|nr:hypothetical protein [Legionella tunisiensis]